MSNAATPARVSAKAFRLACSRLEWALDSVESAKRGPEHMAEHMTAARALVALYAVEPSRPNAEDSAWKNSLTSRAAALAVML